MFKKMIPVLLALILTAGSGHSETWKMDMPHSSIGFTVTHLLVAKVHGKFNDFDVTVQFDGENIEEGSVDVVIKMVSIDTDNERRDNHLRSEDFFDVENYPEMTFKSKKVVRQEGDNYKITGDLTIRGVTREVTLDAVHNGTVEDPWGNTRAFFSATGNINRQDFGVKWNKALVTGGFLVSDEVTINIESELVKVEETE